MKIIVYRGPSHRLRVDGRLFVRGESYEVSDALAARLARDPSMSLEVSSPRRSSPAPIPAVKAATDTAVQGEEESD